MSLTYEQIEQVVLEHVGMIEISSSSLAAGKKRAAQFLVVQSLLSTYLKELEERKAKVATESSAQYATALGSGGGKNVTENKINAEAHPSYTQARERQEEFDAEIRWIKTHIEIFNNAHLMFRQYTKE